jgi:Tol biopolymer transport system component
MFQPVAAAHRRHRHALTISTLGVAVLTCLGLLVLPTPHAAAASAPKPPLVSALSGNLLTGDAATFDTGSGGWGPSSAADVSAVQSPSRTGTGALSVTATSDVTTPTAVASAAAFGSASPVLPNYRYGGSVWVTAASTPRDITVGLVFYDETGKVLASVAGQPSPDAVGSWRLTPPVVATAPTGSVFAALTVTIASPASGETHVIDDATVSTAPGGSPAVIGPLTTTGNTIRDANGNVVTLRGFNRHGMEGTATQPITLGELMHAKAWGANVFRVGLAEYFWLPSSCQFDPAFADRVDTVVRWVTSLGMVALLDLHTNMIAPCDRAGQQPMASAPDSLTFWQQMATRYMTNSLVAFDLYNEPHNITDDVWRSGGQVTWKDVTYQAAGMQQMYDTVRGLGATNLIFVTGNSWGNAWPKTAPISGSNIVYAVHAYTCPTETPPACTTPTPYDPAVFLNGWVTPGKSVPVMITEFGWPSGSNGSYNANVVAFAEAQGWSWSAYTWGNAVWGPFSLLSTAGTGATFEPKPGGMGLLAAFPGFAPPRITAPADGTTNTSAVLASGTASPSTTVTVLAEGAVMATTTTTKNGTWSVATPALGDGPHTLTATAADIGGVTAPSAAVHLTIDSSAPPTPNLVAPAEGALLTDSAVTVAGTSEPGAVVTVMTEGSERGSVTADATGDWSLATTLSDGTRELTAQARDAAGNVSESSAPVHVTVDASPPGAPSIDAPLDATTTNTASITVSGSAEPASVVSVTDGAERWTTDADANGQWSMTTPSLDDAGHVFTATAADAAGRISLPSSSVHVLVDTTAPAPPDFTTPGAALFTVAAVPVGGTAEPGSAVAVYVDGVVVAQATADLDGSWATTTTPLSNGAHVLAATATDAAANRSAPSASHSVTVDTTLADVSVVVTTGSASVVAGDALTVSVTAYNAGPTTATGIAVSATVPPGTSAGLVTSTAGVCSVTNLTMTCTLPALAVASSVTATWRVTPARRGTLAVTATVTGHGTDLVGGNNAAVLIVPVTPGNGRLAFATTRDGNAEIYASNRDGSALKRLTTNSGSDTNPRWSPDGTRLTFTSTRAGNTDIYAMNGDGTGVGRLTTSSARDDDASWSPDGKKVVFTSWRDGNGEIYTMNADGTAATRLTAIAAADGRPSWSPDGQRIAFSSMRDGNLEIYTMTAGGTGLRRLTTSAGADDQPTWSPDGKKIAFQSARAGGTQVFVMNADGTVPTRLTRSTVASGSPTWSPTGLEIVFSSGPVQNLDLFTMAADGTKLTRVPSSSAATDTLPAWQAL